jgi:hypothetical protein
MVPSDLLRGGSRSSPELRILSIMGSQQCVACSRSTDMFLCWDCCKTLKKRLDAAAWIADEIEVTLTRQDRIGETGARIGRATEQPLPFHLAASETAWVLRNTLTTWTRELCETRSLKYDGETSTRGVAQWLSRNVVAIALSEGASEAFDEIDAAVKAAHRVIDRPPGRLYIGPCGEVLSGVRCEADLFVTMGHYETRCPVCGATHSVDDRREQLRDQVRGILGTAAELARLLPWILDSPITRKRITYYERTKMIFPRNVSGTKMYQIGEIIDAHVQFESRHAA